MIDPKLTIDEKIYNHIIIWSD